MINRNSTLFDDSQISRNFPLFYSESPLSLYSLLGTQPNKDDLKFGKPVELSKMHQFPSTKKKRVIIVKNGYKLFPRSSSTNSLLKAKADIPRKKIFTLSRIDMSNVQSTYLSWDAQTLWDSKQGQMRRNSYDFSTKSNGHS